MDNTDIAVESLGSQLKDLLDKLEKDDDEALWKEVEDKAQTIANRLRVKDGAVDVHTKLGESALPETINALLKVALHGALTPEDRFTSPVLEILRVGANLCMDHDANRARLLDVGLPEALVALLQGYAQTLPGPPVTRPFDIHLSQTKVIRTSIGVLLNASIGFDPIKRGLISLELPLTLLKLATAIYPPGSWTLNYTTVADAPQHPITDDVWLLRSGLMNWAWRLLSELKDTSGEGRPLFSPDVLPVLVPSLLSFIPPYAEDNEWSDLDPEVLIDLIDTDMEVLEETVMFIESLSLDVEDIRLSLARGLHFPAEHQNVPCLSIILDFVERGAYPTWWRSPVIDESDRKRKEKSFDMCKAALIKAIVEVAGEEKNEDVLWDDSESEKPGGEFVQRMVSWIKQYVEEASKEPDSVDFPLYRDDMAICASLVLGNLARREKTSKALISDPYRLAPLLTTSHLLGPEVDIKVKHGVIGLLRHLAQAPTRAKDVHEELARAGVVQALIGSEIWSKKADAMADIVQLSAIGVVKHLCIANVEHTYALVLPSSKDVALSTGLAQILALVKRTESLPIRSEGSRVLVNVTKSLFSNNIPLLSGDSSAEESDAKKAEILEQQKKRNLAIRTILTPECAWTLASLVGRSLKYPVLINEGVVALSLFSMQKEGSTLATNAITTPFIAPDTPRSPDLLSPTGTTISEVEPASPVGERAPTHALDALVSVLRNVDNPVNYPVEVRTNVCSFLSQISKQPSGHAQLRTIQDAAKPVLQELLLKQGELLLERAAKKLLDEWS